MSALHYPEDWAAMRAALWGWLDAAALAPGVAIYYREQDAPQPARPCASLGLLTPPVPEGLEDRARYLLGLAVEPIELEADTTYSLTVNGQPTSVATGAEPEPADVAQALAAAVASLELEGVTATVVLDRATLVGGATTMEPGPGLALRVVSERLQVGRAVVTVDCRGREGVEPGEAVLMAERARRALTLASVQVSLRAGGWAPIDLGQVRALPLELGGQREDRAVLDVPMRLGLRALELLDWIESAPVDTGIVGVVA